MLMAKKLLLFIFMVSISSAVFSQRQEKSPDMLVSPSGLKDIVASPNPFSVTTKIKFHATSRFVIEFLIKDLIGNVVYHRKYTTKKGNNSIPFYRNNLDSGIYIYSIKSNSEVFSKRIVIK